MKCISCGFKQVTSFSVCPSCGKEQSKLNVFLKPKEKMEFFDAPAANPGQDGICSDNECPCGFPGATIPRGTGYLYISKELVEFRKDARTLAQSRAKLERLRNQWGGTFVMFDPSVSMPILMCEQGAKKRNLDLKVAAEDARYWWKTNKAPLRATPMAGQNLHSQVMPPPLLDEPEKVKQNLTSPSKSQTKKKTASTEKLTPPKLEKAINTPPPSTPPIIQSQPPPLSGSQNEQWSGSRVWLAIGNLNIFSLGYWLSGYKKRGLLAGIMFVLLLVAGQLLNASRHPVLWSIIFIGLFAGLSINLWFLLYQESPRVKSGLQTNKRVLPILVILVNVVFYSSFAIYNVHGSSLYQKGYKAYQQGDFYTAFGNWYSLTSYYRLSLNPLVAAKIPLEETAMLINTQIALEDSRYSDAIQEIAAFESLFPESGNKSDMHEMGVDAYLGWVDELVRENNYTSALDKLNSVEVAYPAVARSRKQDLEAANIAFYLNWGKYLNSKEDYSAALEKFEHLTQVYPQSSEVAVACDGASQALLGWAEQLSVQQDYEQAVTKLQMVIEHYSQSDVVPVAVEMLPQAYMSWTNQLVDQENYEKAVENLNLIIDSYANSSECSIAESMMPQLFLDWGKQLNDQDHFLLAMEKYDAISEMNPSTDLLRNMEEEYQKTVLALAKDSGEDGKTLLEQAKEQACSKIVPTHPSVGILVDEPGKVINCFGVGSSGGTYWSLPAEVIAETPGTFRYTVLRKGSTRMIGSCPYTNGRVYERYQDVEVVTIRSVATGEVFATKTFYGGYPGACPVFHLFTYSTDSTMGTAVSNKTINDWIAGVLK